MLIKKKGIITIFISTIILTTVLSWIYFSFESQISGLWSISIYTGTDPFAFSSHPLIQKNPVLTASDVLDVRAKFVADPFMAHYNNLWYMVFEVFNVSSRQGDIGLASSRDGIIWTYEQIILDESFHLSYPYIFERDGQYYMIPESRGANAVRLYKAQKFPTEWIFISELIVGDYADPSIVFKDGKWWLFVLQGHDTPCPYYAEELIGPWTQHPESPIIKGDRNIARPGGRLIVHDDKIIRYTQDGEPMYGNQLRVFQIDEISATTYREHEIARSPVLQASGSGWNASGMHHIDPHLMSEANWIACVDGKDEGKTLSFSWKKGGIRILGKLRLKELVKKLLANQQ